MYLSERNIKWNKTQAWDKIHLHTVSNPILNSWYCCFFSCTGTCRADAVGQCAKQLGQEDENCKVPSENCCDVQEKEKLRKEDKSLQSFLNLLFICRCIISV
jgi:hypothetical protein